MPPPSKKPKAVWSDLNRKREGWHCLTITILSIHVMMLTWGATRHSPTLDEPAYLASGLSHWKLGHFELCKVSPPLVRLLAAAPVLLSEANYDWRYDRTGPMRRNEHAAGQRFLIANGERSFWLFTIARWICIPLSILGACVCHRWANELYGLQAGVAAMSMWCFSPNIIAHGQLMTPDTGVTALSVTACYSFWKWTRTPTWASSVMAGITLGLAVLAKTNAIVLFAAFPAVLLINTVAIPTDRKVRRHIRQLIAVPLLAVYIINLGYGFENSFTLLKDFDFVSKAFSGLNADSSNGFASEVVQICPIPLPKPFVEGIDLQRKDFENIDGGSKTFYRGEWYDHGWWWYYFYVVSVKVPLSIWFLGITALVRRIWNSGHFQLQSGETFIILSGIVLFALPCSQTGFGHSLRYVLPSFPFVFLAAASAFANQNGRSRFSHKWQLALLAWLICSSAAVFPHSLSYFNEAGGGPLNGHAHLLDGNMDWGEDFLFLDKWVDEHPESRPLYVAYWGSSPIDKMGVKFNRPSENVDTNHGQRLPGWYAVSVSHICGDYRRPEDYTDFAERSPVGHIGYTIYVYHVHLDDLSDNTTAPQRRASELPHGFRTSVP